MSVGAATHVRPATVSDGRASTGRHRGALGSVPDSRHDPSARPVVPVVERRDVLEVVPGADGAGAVSARRLRAQPRASSASCEQRGEPGAERPAPVGDRVGRAPCSGQPVTRGLGHGPALPPVGGSCCCGSARSPCRRTGPARSSGWPRGRRRRSRSTGSVARHASTPAQELRAPSRRSPAAPARISASGVRQHVAGGEVAVPGVGEAGQLRGEQDHRAVVRRSSGSGRAGGAAASSAVAGEHRRRRTAAPTRPRAGGSAGRARHAADQLGPERRAPPSASWALDAGVDALLLLDVDARARRSPGRGSSRTARRRGPARGSDDHAQRGERAGRAGAARRSRAGSGRTPAGRPG